MSKLKLGVVGCGGIANQKHFPALKNNADLNEIVAFCDIKVQERCSSHTRSKLGDQHARVQRGFHNTLRHTGRR